MNFQIFLDSDIFLPHDSTAVFQQNMLDCYLDRSYREFQYGKFAVTDCRAFSRLQCFAVFLAFYYLQSKSKPELQNEIPPVVLDEPMEINHLQTKKLICFCMKEN